MRYVINVGFRNFAFDTIEDMDAVMPDVCVAHLDHADIFEECRATEVLSLLDETWDETLRGLFLGPDFAELPTRDVHVMIRAVREVVLLGQEGGAAKLNLKKNWSRKEGEIKRDGNGQESECMRYTYGSRVENVSADIEEMVHTLHGNQPDLAFDDTND